MSLLDNVRQTLTDVAGNVVEQSRQLTTQANLQVQIKKLQMERAKRIHELGKQTFTWYQGGKLSVSGPVPLDVTDLCRQLEDIESQLADNERQLEISQQSDVVTATPTTSVTVSNPDPNAPPTSQTPGANTYPPPPPPYAPPPTSYAPPPNPMPYPPTNPPSNPHATTLLPPDNGPMIPPSQNPNQPPSSWPGSPPKP